MADPARTEPALTKHRPALDGVRALAVAAVVTYHVGAPWLPGGFLGVDLFFVLSGFLITGLLLDEVDRTGRIGLARFFTRRARRLLPALYLLLAAVAGWAFFVASPDEVTGLRGAALAALFYVANWFFIATGESYFAAAQGPSPLEHTWSLAIEEQFYLAWPLLLLVLVGRIGWRGLVAAAAGLALASAALMAYTYDASDPTVAYFGTFTRVHELLIGSLLAVAVWRGVTLPASWRWTAWLPLVGIVAMMATVSDVGSFYYRGGSVVFSLLTAWLLLALGAGSAGGGPTRMFTWRPVVWIGLVSYGIYLWHWPLILWLTPVRTGLDGFALAAVRIAVTIAVAAASFYLVERPIRREAIAGLALTPRRMAVAVPLAMVAMSLLIVAATVRAAPADADLDATSAPTALTGSTSTRAPVVAIAGDSIPKELMPYLEAEAAARGWRVLPLAYGGCSITGQFQVDDEGRPFNWSKRCSEGFADLQTDALEQYEPDVVLWYSNRERYPVRVGDTVIPAATPEHRAQLDADLATAYERFTASGADIVIVLPVPRAPAVIGDCAVGGRAEDECAGDEVYFASFAELNAAYLALAQAHADRVTVVEVNDLLCPDSRQCPLIEKDGQAVRPDGIHFSPEGAAWFVPHLLDRAGIDPVEE